MTSKLTKERLQEIAEDGFLKHGESKELARMALSAMDGEPVAEVVSIYGDPEAFGEREIRPLVGIQQMPYGTKLYRHAQPASAVPETAHSSVIAEQLAHVLSGLKVTDHQRAVIGCAVDRLNNVAQLLQLSPSALLVPEILDYQGAKELYNYLMTEEEINATVNAWNACRAAMLQAKSLASINPAPAMGSLPETGEVLHTNSPANPDCWCRTCRPVVLNDMRFVVCPDCGNKRCPRANDHRNACTGSNKPGQEGSAYPASPQSPCSEPATVPGKWIPVSERMPEIGDIVLTAMGGVVNVGEMECSAANCLFFTSVISGRELPATHWMPLPAAPQEVNHG